MRAITVILATLLATPAFAQNPVPASVQVTSDFSAYDAAMSAGKRGEAADTLLAIIDDPEQIELQAEAWAKLADILHKYEMDVAALYAWTKSIESDPSKATEFLSLAMDVAEKVGDDGQIAPVLGQNLGVPNLDAETRSRMAYLAARWNLRQGNYGTANGVLAMVDRKAKIYPDAESLRGVVLAQQGRHSDALAPMLTAQAAARSSNRGDRFENIIDLNVARAYFGAGNFGQSIAYFKRVDRGSEYWPEANYERAWAHFRQNDMPATLALLLNHDSPFFDEWYFPEADLLRAYALFMMCKFTDASKEMDEFVEIYTPLKAELDGILGAMTPEDAFADTEAFVNGEASRMPKMVLRGYRNEDRFAEAIRAVKQADDELARLPAVGGYKFGGRAVEWVTTRREQIIETEGSRILGKATYSQDELAEMLDGIEITRLDLLNLEATMYERAAATGQLEYGDRVGKLRNLKKRKKGYWVWPFDGEFWGDELGWYVIDARPDCPDSMSKGESKSP